MRGRDRRVEPTRVDALPRLPPRFHRVSPAVPWLRSIRVTLRFAGCWQQPVTRMRELSSARKLICTAPAAVTS
eukprot:9321751-Pyramimonas_sp.AAC.1